MDTDCNLDGYAHLLFHDSTSPCTCELDALPSFRWDDCGLCGIRRTSRLEWAFTEKNLIAANIFFSVWMFIYLTLALLTGK